MQQGMPRHTVYVERQEERIQKNQKEEKCINCLTKKL